METYQKILAVIDPSQTPQKALCRAVELAARTGGTVTALMVIYDFSYEMTSMLSTEERDQMRLSVIKDRELWLTDLIEDFAESVAQIHMKVVWHNRPYEAILNITLADHFDTVVKATHEHNSLKSVIFTPTDWHLLRKCPVPVLLVKEHDWPSESKIIAAIHASNEDNGHTSLNNQIIQAAKQFAELLHSQAILANCFPTAAVNLAVEIPEFDPITYTEAIEQHHTQALLSYADKFAIAHEQCIVKEGLAEDVIPQLAAELDAELVVLGTVGRTGLSAALIGNTAEHMLDQINCDVLALKPAGFVCPLVK